MRRARNKTRAQPVRSDLFEFHKAAVEILGMQEQNRFAVGTDLGFARSKNPRTGFLKVIARGENVVHLITDVVNAARRVLVQKSLDGAVFAQRIEQFDLGIGQFDEHHGYTVVGFILRGTNLGPQRAAVLFRCGLKVRHGYGYVVQASDHVFFLRGVWRVMSRAPAKGKCAKSRVNVVLGKSRDPATRIKRKEQGMQDIDAMTMTAPRPTSDRPLLGLTVLVVEDSRFASEALRLMCLRSGARIRRADCLFSARRHLKVYRPSVVVIDLGLPDGSGADLIAELANTRPRVDVILGLSGITGAAEEAIAAGADGFLVKPLASLAAFQQAVLAHLPPDRQPKGLRSCADDRITPDQLAFAEDMDHAAEALGDLADDRMIDYAARFLCGVARSASDDALLEAARAVRSRRDTGTPLTSAAARLAGLVQTRRNIARAI